MGLKILNLYSGIGGNRKLWGDEHDITAVENRQDIADIYADFFPNDTVIVDDAHEYLKRNYKEYDFIWASPPCPTHSNARFWSSKGGMYDVEYPEMKLYQELIFLKHFYSGKYVIENVKPYYEPLVKPKESIGRHIFWSNFNIPRLKVDSNYIWKGEDKKRVVELLGFDLDKYKIKDKTKILRNCVLPQVGEEILKQAMGILKSNNTEQIGLFATDKNESAGKEKI